MLKVLKYLPWSGRRYGVNETGDVFNAYGSKIEPTKNEEGVFVELDWVNGRKLYSSAVLVLLTYDILKLPDHLLDEVIPLFRDGSKTNLAPSNLLYKFKSGPLEVENCPGFYYIPFHVDYAISASGELINISTGKYKSWSVTKPNEFKNQRGGYRYSRVVNDAGFSKVLFQHRALCYVFKEYDENIMDLVINHIDGDPGNNDIENLEIVTYLVNNLHAVESGLRGDNKPVLSRNLDTGEVLRFASINACGRHYGQERAGFVVHRLKNGGNKVYPDMLQFKYDDGTEWEVVDISKIHRLGKRCDIAARNVFTGDIILFEGTPQGEQMTGVKCGTILSHVRENKVIPANGWNFRWFGSDMIWPEHSERHLKVYAKYPIYPPDGAVLFDLEKNEEVFFESVALLCAKMKISKSVFYKYAQTDKIFNGKYKFKLFELRKI